MKHTIQRAALALFASSICASIAAAQIHIANFDSVAENMLGPVYSEDGIAFSELDRYLGSSAEFFVADDASGTLAGMPGFTSPNALGFGSFAPGPIGTFNRCGSFRITPPVVLNRAKIRIFVDGTLSVDNYINMWGYLSGKLAAIQTLLVPPGPGPHLLEFSISNREYDELLIQGVGPNNSGAFFGLVDTVELEYRPAILSYCFGDGSAGTCPCSNPGGSNAGCANSTGQGARITGFFGIDSLLFAGEQFPPTTTALLFRGTTALTNTPFGDGLRCVGGQIERKGILQTDSNGDGFWDLFPEFPVANVRYYQVWYRDNSPNAPCGTGFNVSSGVRIDLSL